LRFQADLKQREIAERIGVSQMQVSRILRRATDQLADQLNATPAPSNSTPRSHSGRYDRHPLALSTAPGSNEMSRQPPEPLGCHSLHSRLDVLAIARANVSQTTHHGSSRAGAPHIYLGAWDKPVLPDRLGVV
jgi:hypothetical protein